jgi:diguanylate cyclase (GGDEF)-like protein
MPELSRLTAEQSGDAAADQRDALAVTRDVAADSRDTAAERRDRTADRRDRDAEQRDRVADDRDYVAGRRHDADRQRGRAGRASKGWISAATMAEVLVREAQGRREAADDRKLAALDRRAGAAERARARTERSTALGDRDVGSDNREAAGVDRRAAAVDRSSASLDGLTGVYLRGAGAVELDREMTRARRTGQSMVVAFVDVNHLKAVNDVEGHAAGDRVLLHVADALRHNLRPYDLIIRYGGDEFVCALTGLDLAAAEQRMAAVHRALQTTPEHSEITVGLAVLAVEDSADDLVARADAALYSLRRHERRGD